MKSQIPEACLSGKKKGPTLKRIPLGLILMITELNYRFSSGSILIFIR
jgi:hypothetical protein